MKYAAAVALALLAVEGAARADGFCTEYAEDLTTLSPRAREAESRAASYSYAVRTIGTYDCPSYGPDGNLRKTRTTSTAHGTAFGYRRDGADTLLLTNEHVAEWPAVTDAEHTVEGVPSGCKRISTSLRIVDDDHDNYATDDIPLALVVADPQLDVAILRAHQALEILPWRVGRSAAIATRDVVEVKGFPLGAFQATNVGKIVSAYDHDDQGEWNHDDFVVDALLSSGGSGSPVLAVSCKTGEFELVGIFHAHYNGASALNVVIGIDQVRDLMTTLQRSPRPRTEGTALDAAARLRVVQAIEQGGDPPFFPYGALVASVRPRSDGALVYTLFAGDFPRTSRPLLVVEDLVPTDAAAFGAPGAAYVGAPGGLARIAAEDADTQALLAHTLDGLRQDALATLDLRTAAPGAAASRDAFRTAERRKKSLARLLDAQREAQQPIIDLAARTHGAGATVSLRDVEAGPTAVASAPAP